MRAGRSRFCTRSRGEDRCLDNFEFNLKVSTLRLARFCHLRLCSMSWLKKFFYRASVESIDDCDLTDAPVQKRLAVFWNLSRIALVLLSSYHVGHGLLSATVATRILSNAGSAYEATLPPPSPEQRIHQAEAARKILLRSSDGLSWLFLLFAAALTPYARICADERRKPNDNALQKHECEPS